MAIFWQLIPPLPTKKRCISNYWLLIGYCMLRGTVGFELVNWSCMVGNGGLRDSDLYKRTVETKLPALYTHPLPTCWYPQVYRVHLQETCPFLGNKQGKQNNWSITANLLYVNYVSNIPQTSHNDWVFFVLFS